MTALRTRNLTILVFACVAAVAATLLLTNLAAAQSDPNRFNRLMKPQAERNAPPPIDGIHDGDTLFVRQTSSVRTGDIAVVRVDGDATVKRFFPESGRIRLQPANSAMEPIYVDASSGDVEVIGLAVGVFRALR